MFTFHFTPAQATVVATVGTTLLWLLAACLVTLGGLAVGGGARWLHRRGQLGNAAYVAMLAVLLWALLTGVTGKPAQTICTATTAAQAAVECPQAVTP